jgi:hypothetical protein
MVGAPAGGSERAGGPAMPPSLASQRVGSVPYDAEDEVRRAHRA